MDAVSARLETLDKEVKEFAEKIENLYAKLVDETDDKKEEKLKIQIKQLEAEKKELNTRRENLEKQLQGGSTEQFLTASTLDSTLEAVLEPIHQTLNELRTRLQYPVLLPSGENLVKTALLLFWQKKDVIGVGAFYTKHFGFTTRHTFPKQRLDSEIYGYGLDADGLYSEEVILTVKCIDAELDLIIFHSETARPYLAISPAAGQAGQLYALCNAVTDGLIYGHISHINICRLIFSVRT